jgi:hypothetical protein
MGAFRSAFLAASSIDATTASQGTLSLRRRFGRGDFIPLLNVEGASTRLFWWGNAPSHGRHQMGVNSGVQWDKDLETGCQLRALGKHFGVPGVYARFFFWFYSLLVFRTVVERTV